MAARQAVEQLGCNVAGNIPPGHTGPAILVAVHTDGKACGHNAQHAKESVPGPADVRIALTVQLTRLPRQDGACVVAALPARYFWFATQLIFLPLVT